MSTGEVLLADEAPVVVEAVPMMVAEGQKKAGWGLILLLGLLAGMGPLAIDMYLPTMPGIQIDLHATAGEVQRTLSSYFAGLAIGQVIYGTMSDRFGRKRPMQFGLVVFALASIGCALSRSVEMLTIMRFMQALGGCAEMVISRAVVRDRFDGREGTRVFSSLMLVMGAAPVVAPMMGGWFATHGGWRMSFWMLAIVAVAAFLMVTFRLEESLAPERRARHGAREIGQVFTGLLRHRHFMAHVLAGSLMLAALFAYVDSTSFVFINIYKVPVEWFWVPFGLNAAGLITSSQVNGWLSHKIAPHKVLRWALIVGAVASAFVMLFAWKGWGGFLPLYAALFVFLCSMGYVFPTSAALAMGPHGRIAGNASALLGCLQFGVSMGGTWVVSALENGTARPMAEVMLGCSAAALVINLLLASHHRETGMLDGSGGGH